MNTSTSTIPPLEYYRQRANEIKELLADTEVIKEIVATMIASNFLDGEYQTSIARRLKDLQLIAHNLSTPLTKTVSLFNFEWDSAFRRALSEQEDIIARVKAKKRIASVVGSVLSKLISLVRKTNVPAEHQHVQQKVARFKEIVKSFYKQITKGSFVAQLATDGALALNPHTQREAEDSYKSIIDKIEGLYFQLDIYRIEVRDKCSYPFLKLQVPKFDLIKATVSELQVPVAEAPDGMNSSRSTAPTLAAAESKSTNQSDIAKKKNDMREETTDLPVSPFAARIPLEDYFRSQCVAGVPTGLTEVLMPVAAAYDPSYEAAVKQLGIVPERGMILYGPPGTGKTVIAKAIAGYLGCPDERVIVTSGSNLLDKYVGETEASIRDLFRGAKKRPGSLHVVIIDEIDAILGTRRDAKNAWERTQVTQFLTELDGINSPRNVFVIGITNCVEHLDAAAIRPGRLGSLIEVPLPDRSRRIEIFELHLSYVSCENLQISHREVAVALSEVTEGFSGADIRAVVQRTANAAFLRALKLESFADSKTVKLPKVVICVADFCEVVEMIDRQKQGGLATTIRNDLRRV